ncbi:DMT family transporter [Amphritea sp. RP18W]|uniref:DMT family transporter n=2 Tax=Amphritea pacifica TaxID=2811233 RepID=A0ABS2WDJ1_9GAMM|nr:DMT family transporter [Amphritea pacifica]
MVGTLVSFMTMAIGGRELSDELSTFQILFFRSLIGLLVISILLQRSGWQQVSTPAIPIHFVRNLAHYCGQFGWFYGLAFIPLAEVFAIEFTVPVWTALLAVFFLGERLTVPRMIAIGLGIVGMLIILRPGLEVMKPAALAVLGGAICYAISHIKTKKLAHIDTPLCILFYMTVIQLPLGLIPALYDWKTPSVDAWQWILMVGLTAMSAHYCLTRAMKLIDATVVVSMDFLRLPLIAAVGFLFYGEPLEWAVLIGALVMLTGNYISNRAEKRKLN